MCKRLIFAVIAFFTPTLAVAAEPPGDIRELKLRDWEPRSMMVTKETKVDKASAPAPKPAVKTPGTK